MEPDDKPEATPSVFAWIYTIGMTISVVYVVMFMPIINGNGSIWCAIVFLIALPAAIFLALTDRFIKSISQDDSDDDHRNKF